MEYICVQHIRWLNCIFTIILTRWNFKVKLSMRQKKSPKLNNLFSCCSITCIFSTENYWFLEYSCYKYKIHLKLTESLKQNLFSSILVELIYSSFFILGRKINYAQDIVKFVHLLFKCKPPQLSFIIQS